MNLQPCIPCCLQYVLHTAHEVRMAWKHANGAYLMGSALFVLGNAAVRSTSCILHQRQDMCSTGAQYFCWPLNTYVLKSIETCGSWSDSSSIRWSSSSSSRHNKSTALEEVGTICMLPGQACTRWLALNVRAGLRRSRCIVQCTRSLLNGISCSCQTNSTGYYTTIFWLPGFSHQTLPGCGCYTWHCCCSSNMLYVVTVCLLSLLGTSHIRALCRQVPC